MNKWYNTLICSNCGFNVSGLPRSRDNMLRCPECGTDSNPEAERRERLAKIRSRDRRQVRVLVFLATLGVAVIGTVFVFAMILGGSM